MYQGRTAQERSRETTALPSTEVYPRTETVTLTYTYYVLSGEMTHDFDPDKQPSLRDALFSDSTIANLRCAVKWFAWQATHLLGFLVLSFIIGAVLLGSSAARLLRDVSRWVSRVLPLNLKRQARWLLRSLRHSTRERVELKEVKDTAKYIGCRLFDGLVLLVVLTAVIMLFATAIQKPFAAVLFAGALLATAVTTICVLWLLERLFSFETVSTVVKKSYVARKKAVETPGVRRVYGKCPVSLTGKGPSWFEKASDRLLDRLD